MGTLDRYVARSFWISYALCAATLTLLYLLIDLVMNLEDLLEAEGSLVQAALEQYGAQLPIIFQSFGAFVTLAGAMFCVARLQSQNELVPIRAGGISIMRALRPVLLGAVILGGVEAAVTEVVIPRAADLIRKVGMFTKTRAKRPGFIRDDLGNTLFAGGYDPATRTLRWVKLRERDASGRVVREHVGDIAEWDPRTERWILKHGWVREAQAIAGPSGIYYEERRIDTEGSVLPTPILPIDVESLSQRVSLLSFSELKRQSYERQRYLHSLRVQLFQRLTSPLAHVILCLLGVPFVLRGQGRQSIFWGVLALIAISAGFYLTTFLCFELGERGTIPALWAALAPPLAFALIAIGLWDRVQS